MKHLCVIQLINSAVRSCGRSLREPVISQCRKGTYQSTVSELFYHTFATNFIIQGNGLCAVPSAQRHPPDGTKCPVEWDAVRPHRKHLFPIQRNVPIPGAGRNGTQAVPYGFVPHCSIHPTWQVSLPDRRGHDPALRNIPINYNLRVSPLGK